VNTLHGQVMAELESRAWLRPSASAASSMTGLAEARTVPRNATRHALAHFRRTRLDDARQPPSARGFGLRLTFSKAIRGPISLGYGSHFGLGAFVPEPD
jgi:CRISPR-associated protein Csb2